MSKVLTHSSRPSNKNFSPTVDSSTPFVVKNETIKQLVDLGIVRNASDNRREYQLTSIMRTLNTSNILIQFLKDVSIGVDKSPLPLDEALAKITKPKTDKKSIENMVVSLKGLYSSLTAIQEEPHDEDNDEEGEEPLSWLSELTNDQLRYEFETGCACAACNRSREEEVERRGYSLYEFLNN